MASLYWHVHAVRFFLGRGSSPLLLLLLLLSLLFSRLSTTGQCLNFNCAFILVLMLRQCITFLRTRGFTAFLPLDQHIYLHKLTGVLVAIYSLVHTIMHLFNFSKFPPAPRTARKAWQT